MRDPDRDEPDAPGGRAAERLRQFLASRYGEDPPVDPSDPRWAAWQEQLEAAEREPEDDPADDGPGDGPGDEPGEDEHGDDEDEHVEDR